jgi:hypothetical protein
MIARGSPRLVDAEPEAAAESGAIEAGKVEDNDVRLVEAQSPAESGAIAMGAIGAKLETVAVDEGPGSGAEAFDLDRDFHPKPTDLRLEAPSVGRDTGPTLPARIEAQPFHRERLQTLG